MPEPSVHPGILHGYGLIQAPVNVAVGRFTSAQIEGLAFEPADLAATAQQALDFLSTVTTNPTRLVFVDLGHWTAVFTNHRQGSDFADYSRWTGKVTGSKHVRVVDSDERWWQRGHTRRRLTYPRRCFAMYAADDEPRRIIECGMDGDGWTFFASGKPLLIEGNFRYDAPRTRDRFTRENLHDLLHNVGPGPMTAERFLGAPRFGLVHQKHRPDEWQKLLEDTACTREQADDPAYMAWWSGMSDLRSARVRKSAKAIEGARTGKKSAAESERDIRKGFAERAVRTFEEALRLDPDSADRVWPDLDEAQRIVAEVEGEERRDRSGGLLGGLLGRGRR